MDVGDYWEGGVVIVEVFVYLWCLGFLVGGLWLRVVWVVWVFGGNC